MSKAKGSRNEHKAMRILEAAGYHTTRAAGSFGLFDIVAINAQGSLDGKRGLLARRTEYIVPDLEGEYELVLSDDVYFLLSCSRNLRTEAVKLIPELIEKLEEESESFTKTVSKAKELADQL